MEHEGNKIQKFGLFISPGSTLVLRVVDGTATLLHPAQYNNPRVNCGSQAWVAIINAKGRDVPTSVLENKAWRPLYGSRAEANFLYGVPDDVDLYDVNGLRELNRKRPAPVKYASMREQFDAAKEAAAKHNAARGGESPTREAAESSRCAPHAEPSV